MAGGGVIGREPGYLEYFRLVSRRRSVGNMMREN